MVERIRDANPKQEWQKMTDIMYKTKKTRTRVTDKSSVNDRTYGVGLK